MARQLEDLTAGGPLWSEGKPVGWLKQNNPELAPPSWGVLPNATGGTVESDVSKD